MGIDSLPLVSVVVITYNSGEYVVETLDSIKEQTYENIELIISDDCSTDETVSICEQWLVENQSRFVRTELLTVERNTGVPANCNRGLCKAKGEWLKFIAGDDKFVMTAISDVVDYVKSNANVDVFDSVVDIYNGDFSSKIGQYNFGDDSFHNSKASPSDQRKMFVQALFGIRVISTLGVFIKKDILEEVGGFDERYRLLEDSPMWWKILKSNRKFYFLNKTTTCYRRHETSISFNSKIDFRERVLSEFKLTVFSFIRENLLRDATLLNKINFLWLDFFYKIIMKIGNKGVLSEYIYKLANYLQPIRFLSFRE